MLVGVVQTVAMRLRAFWREIRVSSFCLRRGCEGSVKSRSAVTDNSRKTLGLYPSRRFSFPPAPSLLGSESSANPPRNRLLIAGKLARKILWDKPVSEIAREFIFSRRGPVNSASSKCAVPRIRGRIVWIKRLDRSNFDALLHDPCRRSWREYRERLLWRFLAGGVLLLFDEPRIPFWPTSEWLTIRP